MTESCRGLYLDEVHEDVSQTLHVVPPALLYPQVRVDAGVPCRACEVLVFPVGNVLVCPGVPVLLGQAEVDDIDEVPLLAEAPEHGHRGQQMSG